MQNPMLQMLRNSSPMGMPSNMAQIKNMMNMVRSAGNPQAMLQSLAQNNPQMQQVMSIVNQSGGDPKAAFYKMAQEKGVDPEQILSMLR